MRRILVALVALALLVPAAAGGATAGGVVQAAGDAPVPQQGGVNCEFPVSVTDATGQTVTVEEEPDRVVALQASAAQTMWEVGAQGKVVGMPVRPYTAYLNGSTERTDVLAEDGSVVQERVVALEPDLVLAPNALLAPNETVESLRQSGLTVYHFRQANSLEYVYEKTRTTGLLVGEYDNASRRAAEVEATVEAVRGAVADEENPRVLYLLGPSGFAAGSNSFIGELVAAAGGNNVAGELEGGYSVVSGETVVAEDPEWIVVPEGRELPKTDAINGTTAVREKQVLRVNDDFLNQPGPRNGEPLKTMARAFHPEPYAAANVENPELPSYPTCAANGEGGTPTHTGGEGTATATATASDATVGNDTGPDGTDEPATTPGVGSPGYTVVTVLVALIAVLAAGALRREH
jgi:iron complex transport system substrate-binding protein